jgi:hypothetical protein
MRSIMETNRVAHRRFLAHDDAFARLEEVAAAAGEQRRKILVSVTVPVRQPGAVNDHRVVQDVRIAFFDGLQLVSQWQIALYDTR